MTAPVTARPIRRRTWPVAAVVVVVVVLVALFALGWRSYVDPPVRATITPATRADAVLALGGAPESGVYAEQLVRQGVAPVLVLSDPYLEPNAVTSTCAFPPAGQRTFCFVPDPSTTHGEALELRRLAAANHWRTVIVVAPTFHLSRARVIVRRCYSGRLLMAAPDVHWSRPLWIYQWAYQTGGFLRAALSRGC